MMRQESILEDAKSVTSDNTITNVGVFQPEGTTGSMVAGSFLGGGGSSWGSALASAGGMVAGEALEAKHRNLPMEVCLAVTPTTLYVLGFHTKDVVGYRLEPIAKIDRSRLGISVHQRLTVRTVELEDLDSKAMFKLELSRIDLHHGKTILDLLMMSPDHQEADKN